MTKSCSIGRRKEIKAIVDISAYIDKTYSQHYVKDKQIQLSDVIEDLGHGEGFYIGNLIKYASRLGRKEGASRKSDLLKLIHYAILLYCMDKTNKDV
jgi:hypothetical protein|tara:strand:- start:2364 stop:2654 length:291 start_codon:yes stop_codon:yes gene_type:complete